MIPVKVWGIVLEDIYSGAVHADIVMGYSVEQVLITLRKFTVKHDWPDKVHSDPGSQLERYVPCSEARRDDGSSRNSSMNELLPMSERESHCLGINYKIVFDLIKHYDNRRKGPKQKCSNLDRKGA